MKYSSSKILSTTATIIFYILLSILLWGLLYLSIAVAVNLDTLRLNNWLIATPPAVFLLASVLHFAAARLRHPSEEAAQDIAESSPPQLLEIQPGDILVLETSQRLKLEHAQVLQQTIRRLFPDLQSVILDDGMTLKIARPQS